MGDDLFSRGEHKQNSKKGPSKLVAIPVDSIDDSLEV